MLSDSTGCFTISTLLRILELSIFVTFCKEWITPSLNSQNLNPTFISYTN